MAEGRKLRVVRCPRCGKLIPELPNFTVYQCGSCGATLQAKKQSFETTQSSPAYSDEMKTRPWECPDDSVEKKGIVASSDSLETGGEGVRIEAAEEESLLRVSGSSSRSEVGNIIGKTSSSKLEGSRVENCVEQIESVHDQLSKPNKDKSVQENVEEEEGIKVRIMLNKICETETTKHEDNRGFAFQRALRAQAESIGLKAPPCPDEAPSSSYHSKISRVDVSEEKQKSSFLSGMENLDQDHVELLRKLDELRDKLRQSGEVSHQPRDRRISEPSRTADYHSPFVYGHNLEVANLSPPLHAIHDANGYGEPMMPRMLGRAHFQHPSRMMDNYLYGELDPDSFISYNHDGFYAHTACACAHCSTSRPWQMPTQTSNAIFSNERASYLPTLWRYHPTEKRSASSRGYNQRITNSYFRSDDSSRRRRKFQQRATSVMTKGQSCQPIAGAAPFVVCYNCLELLRLPTDLTMAVNSKFKLRCGSCSEIITCELVGKRLVISSPPQRATSISGTYNNSNVRILDGSGSQNYSSRHQGISISGEYDSLGYGIPSTDDKLVLPSPFSVSSDEAAFKEYGLDTSGLHKVRGIPSSSSHSENAESPDRMGCQRGIPSYAELPFKTNDTSHVRSVPLHEHLGPPLTNQITNGPGKGNRSRRSDQERILSINGNFKQNSLKDIPVLTEMDVPPDDFTEVGVSQDSSDEKKDDDHSGSNKGGETFLAGFLKKSLRDFSPFSSLESGRAKVSINGYPISDRLIKKAEKQAGQIHPGDYWYDYRAGFWGVMGNACLGIIPPFIEEFNYPMPKTCSRGNTGVLVNGRELHKRDLELLASRGLPTTSGRSYIIEISGKVWDDDSGEELDSLGKLAPTVEKVKHGFGMYSPTIMA